MKVKEGTESITLPKRIVKVTSMIWEDGSSAAKMMTGVSLHSVLTMRNLAKETQDYSVPADTIYFSSTPTDNGYRIEVFPPFPSDGDVEICSHVIERF